MTSPSNGDLRLLLVEDNPADAELVRECLLDTDEAFPSLEVASSLSAALEQLGDPSWSAILLDLNLGDSVGLETLDRVAAQTVSVPIVVLTGGSGDALGVEALSRGAADFLPKDELSGRLLLRSVRYAIERHDRRAAEAKFRAVVESSRDLVTILGRDLTIRYVSPSLKRLLGFEPEEKMGADAALEVHPDDREQVQRAVEHVLGDPRSTAHLQYRVRHRDGTWRPLDTIAQNCLHDPHIRGLLVHSRDISELVEAEEAAQATARRVKRILGALPDAVLTLETEGRRIVGCNPATEEMFGYPCETLVGRSTELLHVDPDSYRRLHDRGDRLLRGRGAFRAEVPMRRRDGSVFLADVALTLLDPARGVEGGAVKVIRDVTSRVERESQVRFLASLLQAVGQPVMALDAEDRITYWNQAAAELSGWTADEVAGRRVLDLVRPESDPEILQAARTAAQSGGHWEGEVRFRNREDQLVIVQVSVAPAVNPDGSPGGRIATGIDLTPLRRTEEQFRQAQKMEAIGRLAGGIAHDFNNLITAIEGHASLLFTELPDSSKLREEVQGIVDAGRRAADLTRRLLAFSRNQILQEQRLDLGRTVSDLETMLRRLIPESIDLRIDTAADAPVVRADRGQLHQVVVNLVVNAVDAISGRGAITISVDAVAITEADAAAIPWQIEPGSYARLSVADTGLGIPPAVMDRLFEPFFTTKPEGRGTGLGLPTVYGIVKQSGGHLLVESTPGEGATFRVLLPRLAEQADRLSEPSGTVALPGAGVVLLVEDDEAIRSVVGRYLRRAGYDVHEAANGLRALELAERTDTPFDLVISDVVMPELGGIELQRQLRERYPDLKVILTTGYSETEARSAIQHLGAAFLPKPFSPSVLLRRVAEELAREG